MMAGCMVFGLNAQALKVDAQGQVLAGISAGANDAVVRIGQGRTANGNALFTLTGDQSAFPAFGFRVTRLANGESRIEHRGNQPLFFNAPDLGGTYKFQIQGQTRVEYTGGAVQPGVAGITNNGTGALPWATVFANAYVTTSDRSLKKDIKDLSYGLQEVLKLRPVSYVYKNREQLGTRIGLIAQEVQPIIDEVVMGYELTNQPSNKRGKSLEVVRKQNDVLSLSYVELVPVLINAIKEQNEEIEEKEERISGLEDRLLDLENKLDEILAQNETNANIGMTSTEFADLSQNIPNPFSGNTQIAYSIPASAKSAEINIFDLHGRLLKTIPIAHTGKGNLNLEADQLPSGTYSYQLVIDKQVLGTKKMIHSK